MRKNIFLKNKKFIYGLVQEFISTIVEKDIRGVKFGNKKESKGKKAQEIK